MCPPLNDLDAFLFSRLSAGLARDAAPYLFFECAPEHKHVLPVMLLLKQNHNGGRTAATRRTPWL